MVKRVLTKRIGAAIEMEIKNLSRWPRIVCLALLPCSLLTSGIAHAAQDEVDDGTNPIKLSGGATIQFKYTELKNGAESGLFEAIYTCPLSGHSALTLTVPVTRIDPAPNNDYGLGDISITYGNVLTLNRSYGIVVSGELAFDSAARPELGTGQTVFQGTALYVKFSRAGTSSRRRSRIRSAWATPETTSV